MIPNDFIYLCLFHHGDFVNYFLIRDHPFKTSACLRGEGCPHVPMFADARGEGF